MAEETLLKLLCANHGAMDYECLLDISYGLPEISAEHRLDELLRESGVLRAVRRGESGALAVIAYTDLRLCRSGGCGDPCGGLHLCKYHLMMGRCGRRSCGFGHQLMSEHNTHLLRAHGLLRLSREELCVLLLQSDSSLLPPVCVGYNRGRGPDGACADGEQCGRLHVCEGFIRGRCAHTHCSRTHDLQEPRVRTVLRCRGVTEELMMELPYIYCNIHTLRTHTDTTENSTEMKQRNEESGSERAVRRRPVFVSAMDVQVSKNRCRTASRTHFHKGVPGFWDQTAIPESGFQRVRLSPSHRDYIRVQQRFSESLRGHTVRRIERVQNRELWERFITKKEQMKKTNKYERHGERLLFHACRPALVDGVCRRNFSSEECEAGAYGHGLYFSRDVQYWMERTHTSSVRCVFACRVLLGFYTRGAAHYQQPPGRSADGSVYDSCVDNTHQPSVFVVFHSAHTYPEFLISCEKETLRITDNTHTHPAAASRGAHTRITDISAAADDDDCSDTPLSEDSSDAFPVSAECGSTALPVADECSSSSFPASDETSFTVFPVLPGSDVDEFPVSSESASTALPVAEECSSSALPVATESAYTVLPVQASSLFTSFPILSESSSSALPVSDECSSSALPVSAECASSALPVSAECASSALPVSAECASSALPVSAECASFALPVSAECASSAFPVAAECISSALPVAAECTSSALPVAAEWAFSALPVPAKCASSALPVVTECASSALPVSPECASSALPVSPECAFSALPVSPQRTSSPLPVSAECASSALPVSRQHASSALPVSPQRTYSPLPVSAKCASSALPVSRQGASSALPVSPQRTYSPLPVSAECASSALPVLRQRAFSALSVSPQRTSSALPVSAESVSTLSDVPGAALGSELYRVSMRSESTAVQYSVKTRSSAHTSRHQSVHPHDHNPNTHTHKPSAQKKDCVLM